MCGIAGFYGFRNDNLIKKISKELEHRGPDGEGFYIDETVTLLNRRLAIIDVEGGNQPIFNEDKSVVVTYNGEIYNFKELRVELENKGHRFSTHSDTEVIVHGYEEWGEKCFDRFNGMFAVALYDKNKKRLILARDHFGIKPLYYSILGPVSEQPQNQSLPRVRLGGRNRSLDSGAPRSSTHKIIFSSEIKPIINSGLIEKKPNDRIIYRYLKFRVHDDGRETFFVGVYRLMPGELLEIRNSKLEIRKFTNLEEELLNKKETKKPVLSEVEGLTNKEIVNFNEKLIDAVRLRLISEVPVGTCLSGGLDSSTVVAVVNRLLKEKVKEAQSVGKIQKTFSAVFPGGSNDEEKYVDSLIKNLKLKIKNYKTKPQPEEFFKEIEEFVRIQEEPTISTGPYAQYKVMQLAHKYVTVVLDGQGADEMLAGYLPYYFVYLKQLFQERKIIKFFKELTSSLDLLLQYPMNRFIGYIGVKQAINIDKLLNSKFVTNFNKEKFNVNDNNLKKRLIEDIFYNSLQSLLRYEDKNAMRFSIEGRVPFLDFNLLRYLFSLDEEAIIKNGWNKYILRQSIKKLLPEINGKRRNKIGFTTPEYQWFMRMKNKIYTIFLSQSFAKRKYFNQPEVLKAFQKFIEGKVNDTMVFWRLLNLELWLRIFFDKNYKDHKSYKNYREFSPNEGKKLEIKVEGRTYLRFPIKTELFKKGDDVAKKAADNIVSWLHGYLAKKNNNEAVEQWNNGKWFVVISEKIVAISQGRSYFIWDIKPSLAATILSKFVTKTPYGIGLGSPWTMELAIREVGVVRVITAAMIAAIAKPLGMKGMFYRIAGPTVRSIDGPTEYSLYPSNVSAKLGPKEPNRVARKIHEAILSRGDSATQFLSSEKIAFASSLKKFLGVAIIDANDLGQNVLGNSTNLPNDLIEKIFKDNPMGQADEQTPIVLVASPV